MPRDKAQRDLRHLNAPNPRLYKLGPQLYLHDDPVSKPTIWPVRNDPTALGKPLGGLWTSSYEPNYGSGWVRWCIAYRYNEPFDLHWTVLTVSKSARLAIINSPVDLAALIERYPRTLRKRRGLDFERLAGEYDGLHLTQRGYLTIRTKRSRPTLAGWGCESTVWFRRAFTRWREIKPHFRDAERFDQLWLFLSGWSTEDYQCHRMSADKASKKVYETMLQQDSQPGRHKGEASRQAKKTRIR
jgi:hypothetical protein